MTAPEVLPILPRLMPTRRPLLACLALCFAALTTGAAHAIPDAPSGDALAQLLHEKGLLRAPAAVARQVRDGASELVISAMNFLGVRYRRGGNTPEQGFDCSGFTRHIFERAAGLVLPRSAESQAKAAALQEVSRDRLEPGDLVFFNTMRRAFSHVGIYVGEGKFIHAPRSGGQVRMEDMREAYWVKRYNGARRVEAESAGAPAGEAPAGTAAEGG